jgi:ferrochelatase
MRIAVVLMNLGGPDGPLSVRSFLFNLFSDKAIINLPYFIRIAVAWIISTLRYKVAVQNYNKMGGFSPLLAETLSQASCLEDELDNGADQYKVFVCMRYWHPMSLDVVNSIMKYEPNKVILLPLYPQFSTTTTGSSFEDFTKNYTKHKDYARLGVGIKYIHCYYNDINFIEAHVLLLRDAILGLRRDRYTEDARNEVNPGLPRCARNDERLDCHAALAMTIPKSDDADDDPWGEVSKVCILFSAHGLPQSVIDNGDPYSDQVQSSVLAIMSRLSSMINTDIEFVICYQSRVGPMKWLEPSTESTIEKYAICGKDLVVVPIAFVSEHIETLVELDIEYAEIAHKYGVRYVRVPTLRTHPLYIKCLANLVATV